MTVWVIAGLLAMATGVRIGWALVNKQSLVSAAMIVALGSLALVAALNWAPLTLLIDTGLGWPNLAVGVSQVALIACAAGSCVMITSVASLRSAVAIRRIALLQYGLAAVVAVVTLTMFFRAGRQPEMAPAEYLAQNLGTSGMSLPWLVPLLYVMLALTLVAWAGVRHSNSSRRGRALFVFTLGIALILLASAFFLLRAVSDTPLIGVGTAVVLLGSAMAVVGAGSLLPTVEDWFAGRRELQLIAPLQQELERRQPDIGIGVRPRGPVVFRVAEGLSRISDALFLEATAAQRQRTSAASALPGDDDAPAEDEYARPDVAPVDQARVIAEWVYAGRPGGAEAADFPGARWLRQPDSYSDREWIIEIARQYRDLDA
ncbi:hypothetical protein [[Mycobacterium] wendilense]|uniref:Uncharacterized protein n=1 Tax=[Mycobacterium] wendilense TaxID=3064284 RepID=A0ABM9M810_9MYCO|nr:hypothetical protein [Mycolicibacterium sp. MU0050]CAJ1578482.1 hypothetical protein MU0050_000092 [Mycolicibacterium sp. MU0050]